MRAEAQAHIDQINAATALLRRFLDWDRAQKRLGELNAMVEDPSLWNDPRAAQEVMRERRRLEEAIGATRTLERELAETSELIEMADPLLIGADQGLWLDRLGVEYENLRAALEFCAKRFLVELNGTIGIANNQVWGKSVEA